MERNASSLQVLGSRAIQQYVQGIFTPLTRDTGKTAWYIDEFGIVLPLVTLCFAIYFWTRRGELSLQRNEPS
jgi:hypothetical protein